MRRGHLLLTLALLALPACGRDTWDRAACTPARPHESGTTSVRLTSAGRERTALLHVPASYDGGIEFPLVFNFHGYAATAQLQLEYADLRPLADEERFLIVAPQGLGSPARFNLERGITGEGDDVQLALDLLDLLFRDLCVDADRVYATGSSNGGGMSGVLGCRARDRFAAIAMVNLLYIEDGCQGPAPAVLGMMGDADLVVPIQGGRVSCCGGWDILPARQTMERWASTAECERDPDDDQVADHVELRRWDDCAGDRAVHFYVIRGGGHTWPGARDRSALGPTNQEIDASEIIWEFFADHPREPV